MTHAAEPLGPARHAPVRGSQRAHQAAPQLPHKRSVLGLVLAVLLLACACDESLPLRIEPDSALEIDNVTIGQGTGGGGIHVSVAISVRNTYEETFDGLVNVRGEIRIDWPGHEDVSATVPVSEERYLHLEPGERYYISRRWHLNTDDGRHMMSLLDFSANDLRYGVLYARPEVLALDVRLTLFEQTGLLTSGPHEFALEGWLLVGDTPDQPARPEE
jgi:hypothetical protein